MLKLVLITQESSASRLIRSLHKQADLIVCVSQPKEQAPEALTRLEGAVDARFWWQVDARSEAFVERVEEEGIDLLLSFRSKQILTASLLALPKIGAFNLHTGPLPAYAGLNVSSWAIFNGESEHGCTLHWMDPGIDTGAIAYRETFPIAREETGLSLTARCVSEGVKLARALIQAAACGETIPRLEQDLSERRYFGRGPPGEGWFDWTWNAAAIDRLVRASCFHPYPSDWGTPRAILDGREIAVLRSTSPPVERGTHEPGEIVDAQNTAIDIATGDGVLRVLAVMSDGKAMTPEEWLGAVDPAAEG